MSTPNNDTPSLVDCLTDYHAFLASKRRSVQPSGFRVDTQDLNANLWDWQALVTQWSLGLGRSALFEDCGLGKTLQQLEWACRVHQQTRQPVLILCPLVVAWQTLDEAQRFEIDCPVNVAESASDVAGDAGIVITNYDKLHLFDVSQFAGVVLDESSILKNYTGKTKQLLIDTFRPTPFKLCCTATPAPNDYLELGNHAEFLGIMPSNEMIARWFINDGAKCGNYRLKKHGEEDFWRWMASWAICISKPSDLGDEFTHEDFTLPELLIHEHIVGSDTAPKGHLINPGRKVSATNKHQEKRASLEGRCRVMADLAKSVGSEPFAMWCETDYEADCILKCLGVRGDGRDDLGGVVEVRGSHSNALKHERLQAFVSGKARVIITKASIAGFGSNWQHCNNTAFFATFSYEDLYQLIRRFLRYGQKSPRVNCHLVASENEESVVKTTREKEAAHLHMKSSMAARVAEFTRGHLGTYVRPQLREYQPGKRVDVPRWLMSK